MIEFTAPIRIESEMNRREHWTARKKRFDAQRGWILASWFNATVNRYKSTTVLDGGGTVTLTRVGPRKLDTDNLAGGFKAVRDEIARLIGIDDGDERIKWLYAQEKGRPHQYAVRVKIEACGASEPATKREKRRISE